MWPESVRHCRRLDVLRHRGQFFQPSSGEHLPEVRKQFLVNEAVAGQYFAAVEAERRSVEARYRSARFLHEKDAGSGIPRD